MYALEITLKGSPHKQSLFYRGGLTAETAEKDVVEALSNAETVEMLFSLSDDYGRKLLVRIGDIAAVVIANMQAAVESMVENQLVLARANADIMMKASSDPKLKLLGPQMGGLKLQ